MLTAGVLLVLCVLQTTKENLAAKDGSLKMDVLGPLHQYHRTGSAIVSSQLTDSPNGLTVSVLPTTLQETWQRFKPIKSSLWLEHLFKLNLTRPAILQVGPWKISLTCLTIGRDFTFPEVKLQNILLNPRAGGLRHCPQRWLLASNSVKTHRNSWQESDEAPPWHRTLTGRSGSCGHCGATTNWAVATTRES